jgi:beta-phosphoglucomutase
MIRAILFDLDGTLIDSEAQTMSSIARVVEKRGHIAAPFPPELACGRSWQDIATELLARYPMAESVSALVDDLQQIWDDLVAKESGPLPGVREALSSAHSAGLLLAVVSSSPRRVIDAALEKIGASSLVSVRVGSDSVTRYKPDPEGFLLGASLLGVAPSECLVFEDSTSGISAARAAGMLTVAVLCVSRERELVRSGADRAIEHYGHLPEDFFQSLSQIHPPQKTLARLTT